MTGATVFRVMKWALVIEVVSPFVTFIWFLPNSLRLTISFAAVGIAMITAVTCGMWGMWHYRSDKYARWSAGLAALVVMLPIGAFVGLLLIAGMSFGGSF